MGILTEVYSVIVRVDAINEKMSDGVLGFKKIVPNATFCTDGELCRVGFMSKDDAFVFASSLFQYGLAHEVDEKQVQQKYIAFTQQGIGLLFPCDWLELTINQLADGNTVGGVRFKGSNSNSLATQYGWTIEQHLSLTTTQSNQTINAKKEGRSYVVEHSGEKLYTNITYEPIDASKY